MTKEDVIDKISWFVSIVFCFTVLFGVMYVFSGLADRLHRDRLAEQIVGGVVIDRYRDGFDGCHIVVENNGEVYNLDIQESCYYSIEIGDVIYD